MYNKPYLELQKVSMLRRTISVQWFNSICFVLGLYGVAGTTVDEEITLAPDDDDDDIVVSPVTVVTTGPSTEPCGAPPQLGKLDSKSSTQFSLSLSLTPTTISLSISFFLVCNPVIPILLSHPTCNYSRTQTRCSHGRHVLDYI